MAIHQFPPVEHADPQGLLALGGDLSVPSLVLAYRSGIFPWPMPGYPLAWFAPPDRALLFLDEVHLSKSLIKSLKRPGLVAKINHNVPEVIQQCQRSQHRMLSEYPGPSTWITEEMERGYSELAQAGYCHSVAVFEGEDLIGGLYGVCIGAMFAGESMFYLRPNGSKIALAFLASYLKNRGVKWIDCQQLTPLLSSFGARCVRRSRFMELLKTALMDTRSIFPATESVIDFDELGALRK